MKHNFTVLSLILISNIFFVAIIHAQDKGLEVARKWDLGETGFIDSYTEIQMVLVNAYGEKAFRDLKQKTLESPDENEGDKTLIAFETPLDVKGVLFLSHAKIKTPDNQWLYLPAIKRVKRVLTKNKSGPFLGSEFAYEDISGRELLKYTYQYFGEDRCGENQEYQCEVVDQEPNYEGTGYSKLRVWYNRDKNYRQEKIEFYDRKSTLLKTLRLRKYQQYNQKFWRAHDMFMENHQTLKTTYLLFSNFTFGNGYVNSDFDRSILKLLD